MPSVSWRTYVKSDSVNKRLEKAMALVNSSDVAIIVVSCDKYSDLWAPLFDLFFKNWPDCPYPVYLVANQKKFDHERVETLLSGEDHDWSSSIRRAVAGLKHNYFLFWIDDAFPIQPIKTDLVKDLVEMARKGNWSFLRLRPNPTPACWLDKQIGKLGTNDAYRVSLFATLWRTSEFHEILLDGESAWDFEVKGTERSHYLPEFYCTRKEIFTYLHGVERGVWLRSAAFRLERMGYHVDYGQRPLMSRRNHFKRLIGKIKLWILYAIPAKRRQDALKTINRFYRLVGLRR